MTFRFEISRRNSIVVGNILAILERESLYSYAYNGAQSGCLWWCKALIYVLQNSGMLPDDSLRKLHEHLARVRKTVKEKKFRYLIPDAEGIFLRNARLGRDVEKALSKF